jgi:hypothetical protein
LKANFTSNDIEGISTPLQLMYCPEGKGGVAPVNIAFIAGEDCKMNKTINIAWPDPAAFTGILHGGIPYAYTKQWFGTLDQDLKVSDGLTLTSITGLYRMSQSILFPANTGAGATQSIVADNPG